ncbi:hypothetical protein [Pseudofulvimonas gallinarii]|jgi:phytoene synthase|uniref:Farnesyl-diphosphate farnesyltransferase n=1 Tax=Pseudofulvimonas gallinarii TaxID=634155 RepID=A0A4R3LJF6_9GAMM|nr:hypothetical protein [Pseudofulvimonas gallinarii]TCS99618.1 farnesyl-diphosphate farnesyltransferase [Pseudofulvimonas gallinarii]THD14813.1 hypothetical protein B1808_01980 [Pseudofulvimonas gallinarii]
MSTPAPHQAFIDKWLAAEPWHRLLLVFESSARRDLRAVLECIGFELRQAALTRSDPRVAAVKLEWWLQEWTALAEGAPRHPLTRVLPACADASLQAAGAGLVQAALGLASEDSEADLAGLVARWRRFADAQAALDAHWLPEAAAAELHAFALVAEQVPHASGELGRGRLPLPLSLLARHGGTRTTLRDDPAIATAVLADHARALLDSAPAVAAEGEDYRRRQAALARLRLASTLRDPRRAWAGDLRLPALRALWSAWRAR